MRWVPSDERAVGLTLPAGAGRVEVRFGAAAAGLVNQCLDRISRELEIEGPLDADQRQRLLEIVPRPSSMVTDDTVCTMGGLLVFDQVDDGV